MNIKLTKLFSYHHTEGMDPSSYWLQGSEMGSCGTQGFHALYILLLLYVWLSYLEYIQK